MFAPAGFSWALFEFARNPYYMLIVTYVFPPYFAQYIVGDSVEGQAVVADATTWAGIIGALTAPILGAMMDRGGARKPVMGIFLAMIAVSGAALWWSMSGAVPDPADPSKSVFHPTNAGLGVTGTMMFLILGFVGYTYSEMMHNAMLKSAGRPKSLAAISGMGIGLGQLSSALCLAALVVVVTTAPQLGAAQSGFLLQRGAGPFVAIWMLALVLPFFLFMPDGGTPGGSWRAAARKLFENEQGKLDPVGRFFKVGAYIIGLFKAYPNTMKFLVARLIYADGMIALLGLGGVYTAGVLGWDFAETALYGIYGSIFGVVGGIAAGPIDRAMGARRAIILELVILCICVVVALSVTQTSLLYGLIQNADAVVHTGPYFNTMADLFYLGLVAVIASSAAACISSSRYLMVVLAPKDRLSEFFGLYALSSSATVWLGPILIGFATRTSGDQRIGFSPVLLLLAVGLGLMLLVKPVSDEKGQGATPAAPAH
jgi:UMF1 family MFS transporter